MSLMMFEIYFIYISEDQISFAVINMYVIIMKDHHSLMSVTWIKLHIGHSSCVHLCVTIRRRTPEVKRWQFDDDPIKSQSSILRTTCSPLFLLWESFSSLKEEWPEIELLRDFMAVLVTWKFDEDPIKYISRYPPDNIFPDISQWERLVVVETRVLVGSAPNTYAASLTPVML